MNFIKIDLKGYIKFYDRKRKVNISRRKPKILNRVGTKFNLFYYEKSNFYFSNVTS